MDGGGRHLEPWPAVVVQLWRITLDPPNFQGMALRRIAFGSP